MGKGVEKKGNHCFKSVDVALPLAHYRTLVTCSFSSLEPFTNLAATSGTSLLSLANSHLKFSISIQACTQRWNQHLSLNSSQIPFSHKDFACNIHQVGVLEGQKEFTLANAVLKLNIGNSYSLKILRDFLMVFGYLSYSPSSLVSSTPFLPGEKKNKLPPPSLADSSNMFFFLFHITFSI